jgi:6-phosphogluconolactonase
MTIPQIKVLPDANAIAIQAAERIVAASKNAIELFDEFSLVLSGGSTPKMLYELLASDEYRERIEWDKVRIFFGDERCVPPDHAESNYRMARIALLSEVPIPGDHIYRMRGEIEPEAAAIEYGKLLKEKFADAGPDLILLGMGDDGHTASLFPHTTALKETKHRCVSNYVDKLGAWRITLTAPFINRASEVMVLVSGASKASTLTQVLEGARDPERLPIQLIEPASGKMTWLLDVAAAGMSADEVEG